MRQFKCEKCGANFSVADEDLQKKEGRVRCPRCHGENTQPTRKQTERPS